MVDLAKTGRFTNDEMEDLIESAIPDRKTKELMKKEITSILRRKKSTRRR